MFRMLSGSTEFIPITLTENTGKNISTATYQIAFLAPGTKPDGNTTWNTPELVTVVDTSTVLVRILVGPANVNLAAGRWRPWAKITDLPEQPIIPSEEDLLIY